MRLRRCIAAALALALSGPLSAQPLSGEKQAAIPAIPGVVASGAKWQRSWQGPMTADGITGTPDGALLFAQEQSNSIRKLWPDGREWVQWPYIYGAGAVSIDAAGRTFAVERTCTDPGLHLSACAEATRVVQLTPARKVLASQFADGKPLGRLNDVAADGLGGAYFTQTGIYHVAADGTVSTVAEGGGGVFTNGLVLSPDGRTLYVTNRNTILAFDVGPNGATSNRRDFATLPGEPKGFGADGLAVDRDGRLYATGPDGVYVFDRAGKSLGVIPTPRLPITIAFAGPDRRTLYIGAMGAADPDGKPWATPEGVRNVAMTIYRLRTQSAGPSDRPK